jgi:expansin
MPQSLRIILLALLLASALGGATRAYSQPEYHAFLPLVAAPLAPQNPAVTGEATYYVEANGDGNCLFGPSPDDLMVAALGYLDYGNPLPEEQPEQGPAAIYCGAYVEVVGPSGTIVVRIVDKCPDIYIPPNLGCDKGHLDLSPEAFARIAPIEQGRVPITWRVISPDLGRPIAYHVKPGSNRWWTAIQVRHHRNPIVSMEYRDVAGEWRPMVRQDYNYFVARDMGLGPYTLRVTDRYGNVLEDSGIPLVDDSETTGRAQFPRGP